MKKLRPLKPILSDLYDAEVDDFKLEYGGNTFASSADVLSLMIENWEEWVWAAPSKDQMNTVQYFVNVWKRYVQFTIENLAREMDAMYSSYDPISNYDLNEQEATGHRIDNTTNTTTPNGTATTTTAVDIYGYDSSNGANSDVSTTDTSYSAGFHIDNENKPGNTKTMEFAGDTHSNYHDAEERFMKRSGNIGVTTSQQMIQSEIDLRKQDLIYEYIKRFIDRYCFYVG